MHDLRNSRASRKVQQRYNMETGTLPDAQPRPTNPRPTRRSDAGPRIGCLGIERIQTPSNPLTRLIQ